MDNLISRQAAIDAICNVCGNDCDTNEFIYDAPQDEQVIMCPEHYVLSNLPSVKSERKKGNWLIHKFGDDAKCSECGMTFRDVYDIENSDSFCRRCGAKMEGLKVVY